MDRLATKEAFVRAEPEYSEEDLSMRHYEPTMPPPPMSEKHKAKLRAANTGRKHSPETIEKMRAARLKQPPISEETRERMRIARRNRDPETSIRAGKKLKGRKHTAEHKAAISAGLKKAWDEGRRTWQS